MCLLAGLLSRVVQSDPALFEQRFANCRKNALRDRWWLESQVPRAPELFALVAVVVATSIVAHSSTDVLVAHWFARVDSRASASGEAYGIGEDTDEAMQGPKEKGEEDRGGR